jgi:hypothetical protein
MMGRRCEGDEVKRKRGRWAHTDAQLKKLEASPDPDVALFATAARESQGLTPTLAFMKALRARIERRARNRAARGGAQSVVTRTERERGDAMKCPACGVVIDKPRECAMQIERASDGAARICRRA